MDEDLFSMTACGVCWCKKKILKSHSDCSTGRTCSTSLRWSNLSMVQLISGSMCNVWFFILCLRLWRWVGCSPSRWQRHIILSLWKMKSAFLQVLFPTTDVRVWRGSALQVSPCALSQLPKWPSCVWDKGRAARAGTLSLQEDFPSSPDRNLHSPLMPKWGMVSLQSHTKPTECIFNQHSWNSG